MPSAPARSSYAPTDDGVLRVLAHGPHGLDGFVPISKEALSGALQPEGYAVRVDDRDAQPAVGVRVDGAGEVDPQP